MTTDIQVVIQSLSQDAKLDLFEIDVSQITGTNTADDHIYFHAGTNQLCQPVVWQGKTYNNIPATADGFDISTKGTLPRPKLQMSNVYSAVSAILETIGGDLTGAMVIRRQTYARYLDAVNFPARTSIMNWTEDLRQWTTLTGILPVLSALPDARGEVNKAVELQEQNTNTAHLATINASPDFIIGQTVTAWAELKAGGRTEARIKFSGTAGVVGQVTVNLLTGAVVSATNTNRYTMQKLGDQGWWLVMMTSTVPAAGKIALTVQNSVGGAQTYVGSTGVGILVGRTQVFTQPANALAGTNVNNKNIYPTLPYQYVGSSYNPNPDTDPTRYLPDETFFVERKVTEDEVSVEFELSSAIDLEGLQLPRRVITQGYCSWDEYRGEGCMYTGTNYFDADDNPTTDPNQDVCSRSVNGCKIRFGTSSPLPFGGFPAVKAYQY